MVLAVGLIIAAAQAGTIAAGLSALTTALISFGLAVVGTLATMLLTPSPPKQKMADGLQVLKQAIPPRSYVYGFYRLGGPYIYYKGGDSMTQVIVHAAHRCDAVTEYWLNDESVNVEVLDPATPTKPIKWTVTSDPYDKYKPDRVTFRNYLGTSTQVLDVPNDNWDPLRMKGHGLCCTVLEYSDLSEKHQYDVFPNGPPTYNSTIRGALIYDPRNGTHNINNEDTWTWNDNSALCILDYLTRKQNNIPIGFGFDIIGDIDMPSFTVASNKSDSLIALKAGGTEKRYRTWGAFNLDEDRKSVLNDLLAICNGQLIQMPSGKIGISVGDELVSSDVTILTPQILEVNLAGTDDATTRVNEVRITYVSNNHGWKEIEAGIQFDQDAIDLNGLESTNVKARFCPSEGQAQRIAKAYLHSNSPKFSGTITGHLALMDAWGQRWINLNLPEIVGASGVYEVSNCSLNRENMTVTLTIKKYDAWYSWNAAVDEQDPQPMPDEEDDPDDVPVPENCVAVIDSVVIDTRTTVSVGVISWDPPPRDSFLSEGRWKAVTDTVWQNGPVNEGENSFRTGVLENAKNYHAQSRFIGPRGTPGDWSNLALFTGQSDPIAAMLPINLLAVEDGVTVDLTVTASNDPRFAGIYFYRNTSNTSVGATRIAGPFYGSPGGTFLYTDTPPSPGDWWYFASSVNWSGVESALTTGVIADVPPVAPLITTTSHTVGNSNPVVVGTAYAGSTVKVFVNGVLNQTTTATGGNWSVTLASMPLGAQSITATATVAGNESDPSGFIVLTRTWDDPNSTIDIDFKNQRYKLAGVYVDALVSGWGGLFTTITTSTQLVTMSTNKLKSIAVNALPLNDLGFEGWAQRTNVCTNYNAKPTTGAPGNGGWTLSGDAAATLTIVDETIALNAVGSDLSDLITATILNGFVLRLNNSAGTTDARVTFTGQAGVTTVCSGSVFTKGSAGRLELGGSLVSNLPVNTAYHRTKGTRTPTVTTEQLSVVAPAGADIFITLNQLEVGAMATSPIVVAGASATRNSPDVRRTTSTEFNDAEGYYSMRAQVAAGNAVNAIACQLQINNATNMHYYQALSTANIRGGTLVGGSAVALVDKANTGGIMQCVRGYKLNDYAYAVNGGAETTSSPASVPTNASRVLTISTTGVGGFSGLIERFWYGNVKPVNSNIRLMSGWTYG